MGGGERCHDLETSFFGLAMGSDIGKLLSTLY